MWQSYAEEYGTSMHELSGQPASRGRLMYLKQQATYELPQNELLHAPISTKLQYSEPKTVKHTSQMVDVYVNPQHLVEEDRPKRRTLSPSRPKVQSKELLTGKRGSRAAEMFVRAREHTDQHVIDEEKVTKRRQARNCPPWGATFGYPTINVDEPYDEPVSKKFQNVTSPSLPRKPKPKTKPIEQVDYSYSNGYRPRSSDLWKSRPTDSERLKRFHKDVEPYKMNYNRAPTGWANSSESSDLDAFDLGSIDAQLPKEEFRPRMFTTKTRQGRLRDYNSRPRSWSQDYDDDVTEPRDEVMASAETVRSRRVQFEEHSKSPRQSRKSKFAPKFRQVAGPKNWFGLPQSEDL
ncbi:uncharacterized protein LOC117104704 [Anneissia japonica]|uniref:uncharacterized protein LOC117104704 n=1 Tax=Anneissia japonica TaxID=1529436 RepID=UPI0014254CFD|nr:uncharacterized protein LOC117104704 [Anneissia japonica]